MTNFNGPLQCTKCIYLEDSYFWNDNILKFLTVLLAGSPTCGDNNLLVFNWSSLLKIKRMKYKSLKIEQNLFLWWCVWNEACLAACKESNSFCLSCHVSEIFCCLFLWISCEHISSSLHQKHHTFTISISNNKKKLRQNDIFQYFKIWIIT